MNISELKQALKVARKLGVTLNIIGPHGIGKSSGVKQYAKENGMNYTEFRTGQAADQGDLTGLPDFQMMNTVDVDGSELVYKFTDFVLPAWFPRKKNTVVFFDEVNRGAKDILNGVFETILDLSMKGIPLPEGCQVVSAMNPPTSDYSGTIDFDDKAFVDRFVHVKLMPTFNEFLQFHSPKYGNGSFLAFLQEDNKMLEMAGEAYNLSDFVTPSRRSWETALKLEQLFDNGEVEKAVFRELLFGTIGATATDAALAFKETHVSSIKGVDVIENFHKPEVRDRVVKSVKNGRTDIIGNMIQEIDNELGLRKGLTNQEGKNLINVCKDLNPEQSFSLCRIFAKHRETSQNVEGFAVTDDGGGLLGSDDLIEVMGRVAKARDKAKKEMEKAKKKKEQPVEVEEEAL